jgi:multidrug resistance efflux pump
VADTLAAMLSRETVADAARVVADRLPARLGSVRMAIATSGASGACRLQAVTGVVHLDRRADMVLGFEAALDEVVLHGGELVFARGRQSPIPAKTHEHLGRLLGCGWIVSTPLRNAHGRIVGAWLLWGDATDAVRAAVEMIENAGQPVAVALDTIVRANHGVVARFRQRANRWLNTRRKRRLAVLTALAVVGLAALPLPYKLRCDCTVEPVVRRFVAAPFAATLDRALVQPGDVVRAGQTLATLDGRELRWELAALVADRQQAEKARDAALADRKVADAQLARLEIEQLENRIQLLRSRQDQLEIKCPLDGMVVSGDLERVEGAPLAVGQTLFEVAPLDRVIVEIAVPESEIASAEIDADVAVRLDACPHRRWHGQITRIHPRAELRDTEQVFIAEVEIANLDGHLQPGTGGRAKITGPWAPLAWIAFHRPIETAARWLGW